MLGERIASKSEVIRAIVSECSPCCWVPHRLPRLGGLRPESKDLRGGGGPGGLGLLLHLPDAAQKREKTTAVSLPNSTVASMPPQSRHRTKVAEPWMDLRGVRDGGRYCMALKLLESIATCWLSWSVRLSAACRRRSSSACRRLCSEGRTTRGD